jgi:hypothetical protein
MYEFRQVNVDNKCIKICTSLLQNVFPKTNKFTEAFLKWEYADNPVGKIVGFNAFAGDELAAHYVTQPIIVNLFGKETQGLLSLNTATNPKHQGRKLFTSLAEMTYQYAFENGFQFVIGVANANSTPGFLKKLGFQFIAPLLVKIGTGKIFREQGTDIFSWERSWSEEEINWRIKNPVLPYELKSHRLYAPSGKFGIKAIMGDFPSNLYIKDTGPKLHTLNPFKMYVGLDSTINWSKSGFMSVPERFKTSPLNLIFRDLSGKGLKLDKDNIKFQLIDFDVY